MHGPHSIQIAYDDPFYGPLAMGGALDVEPGAIARAWSRLGSAGGAGSPWQARLFDEHANLLEERRIAGTTAWRLLGAVDARLALARAQYAG